MQRVEAWLARGGFQGARRRGTPGLCSASSPEGRSGARCVASRSGELDLTLRSGAMRPALESGGGTQERSEG